MILIGQLDSPFVRRVAIALAYYRMPYEARAISTYDDFEAVRAINPLGKVPVLVLDDGSALVDSTYILEFLDERAGERALTPRAGSTRLRVLAHTAVALGLAKKSVEYRTESVRRPADKVVSERVARIAAQIASALAWLAARTGPGWLVDGRLSQADVTQAVAFTNLARKNADICQPDAILP